MDRMALASVSPTSRRPILASGASLGKDRGSMNWVDLVLLVVVALSAVQGLRLGAAMQVLSYGSFLVGLVLGVLLAPSLARLVHDRTGKFVVAAVVVFGVAAAVGAAGRLLGSHSSIALRRLRLGPLDSGLGVAVAVLATLVASWMVSSVLVNSRFPQLDAGIAGSRIVRALDSVLPNPPAVFARIQTFFSANGFPTVFAGIPPVTSGPVSLPPTTSPIIRDAVAAAEASTVKIVGEGCGVIQEGSGFVVAPGYVVTNAHVVAGIAHPQVQDASGAILDTSTMLYDPELDVAVLRVAGLNAPALRLDSGPVVPRGATGAVLGYPGGGPFTYGSAGVMAAFRATGFDIYNRNQTDREVYELDAIIRPGNSGGPLVYESASPTDPLNGSVIGVVFARSTSDGNVGYALATPAVAAEVQQAEVARSPVSTQGCTG